MSGESCFAVRPTIDYQGHGLFVTTEITAGRRIFQEAPLITLPRQEHRDWKIAYDMLPTRFAQLLPSKQRQFLLLTTPEYATVDGAQSCNNRTQNQSAAANESLVEDIFSNNMFEHRTMSRGRGVALFLILARVNHSCCPNAVALGNPETDVMTLHAVRDIPVDEEITICYTNVSLSRQVRCNAIQKYGFVCRCAACAEDGSLDADEEKTCDVRESISRIGAALNASIMAQFIDCESRDDQDGTSLATGINGESMLAVMDCLTTMLVAQQLFCVELATWYQWAVLACINAFDFEAARKWLQLRLDLNQRIRGSDHPETLSDGALLNRLKHKLLESRA